MNLGLTLSNRQWSLYSDEEVAAILDLRPSAILIIGYPESSVLPEKVAQEAGIWEQLGRCPVVLRPYAPEIIARKPEDWSFECYMLVQKYRAYGITPEMVGANELNHWGERGRAEGEWVEDWPEQVAWLQTFAKDFRMRSPNTVLHAPALSPNGNYLDGISHYLAMTGYDVMDLHCYSLLDLQDIETVRKLGAMVAVTEFNQVSMSEVARLGVPNFYFLVSSEDAAFDHYSLLRNPALYFDFLHANIPPKEEPMPEEEGYSIGPGMWEAMERNEDSPVEDEHYVGDRESFAAGEKGLYIYNAGSGRVALAPFV